MKKFLLSLLAIFMILGVSGCKDKPGTSGEDPEPTKPIEHFDPDKVMYDNPEDWPSDTFFINVPAVRAKVDDLAIVFFGDKSENQLYTMTIKEMDYSEFKTYTDKLINAGFNCTRASYWLPDKESDLSNNYSQCVANSKGTYIKANWYKNTTSSYNFQMTIANYDMDKAID